MLIFSRVPAICATAVILAGAAAGCGSDGATWAGGAPDPSTVAESSARPQAAPPPSGVAPASAGVRPTPSSAGAQSTRATRSARPARPPATKRATTKPATGTGPRITSVSLTAPNPRDGFGRPVSAIHQESCGTPDAANIWVEATDPGGRLVGMYYTYEVATAVPVRGRSDDFAIGARRGDTEVYKTVIGPITANPANRAGGKITITVHVVNTAGKEAPTKRITATLLACP